MIALNVLPMCLLRIRAACTVGLVTVGSFCFSTRSLTYSHAPPPPTPPAAATTIQSSGRSSGEIIVNFLPWAIRSLAVWIMRALSPLRVPWIDDPTSTSATSCSVRVRIFGRCCASAVIHVVHATPIAIAVICLRFMESSSRRSVDVSRSRTSAVP